MVRPDPKLFIVWSSKYKYIAEQIKNKLAEKRKYGFPVYPVMFNIGSGANQNKDMYTSLIDAMDSADYALILMTPDEEVLRRDSSSLMSGFYATSRPNVYYEYGYLTKHLSERNIFVYNAHGSLTASDTSALIINSMRLPSNFDEIIKLPERIVSDLENFFREEKSGFFIDLNQESYTINYTDVFYDASRRNAQTSFIINNSINLGKYWRYELERFPKDPYQIGRKIIYILERLPFNVYLYASPHSTNSNERPQNFIDTQIINTLRQDITSYLKTMNDPNEFRNYKLYSTCLSMLEVIEKYQIKRNDSLAFAFDKDTTYAEETHTLFQIEEYITRFPLSQVLFNRYTALCFHKKTLSMYNLETIDFKLNKKIDEYYVNINKDPKIDNNYFIAIIQLSMALSYINKTIQVAKVYDNNNSIALHRSLAEFDKGRIEFLFQSLINIGIHNNIHNNSKDTNLTDKPMNLTNNAYKSNDSMLLYKKIEEMLAHTYNQDYLNELIMIKIRAKLHKSFHYGLIDFFNKLFEQYDRTQFTIEMIELLTNDIIDLLMITLNKDKTFDVTSIYTELFNTESSSLNKNKTKTYYNKVNHLWKDSPFDIVILKKSHLFGLINNQVNEKDTLETNIIRIITNALEKINITVTPDDLLIYINGVNNDNDTAEDSSKQSPNRKTTLYGNLHLLIKDEMKELLLSIFHDLENNMNSVNRELSGYDTKWEKTMDTSIELRHNMWIAAKDWPSNMRSILLYEYYHALSEKYIYKISENLNQLNPIKTFVIEWFKECNDKVVKCSKDKETVIKNISLINYSQDVEDESYINYKLLITQLNSLKDILVNLECSSHDNDSINTADQLTQESNPTESHNINCKNCNIYHSINVIMGITNYCNELDKIRVILENAKRIMEFNYEIPDISQNILEKIQHVLQKKNIDWGIKFHNLGSGYED